MPSEHLFDAELEYRPGMAPLAARAVRSETGAKGRLAVSRPAGGGWGRPGPGGLWLQLVPLACCGGPLLIAILAAGGALA